jgi:hypothetical protein
VYGQSYLCVNNSLPLDFKPRRNSRYAGSTNCYIKYDFDLPTQKEFVKHVETTLARSLFNCDELYVIFFWLHVSASPPRVADTVIEYRAAYSGTALAFRDRLVIEWNKTQQRQTFADQKRVYCRPPGEDKPTATSPPQLLILARSFPGISHGPCIGQRYAQRRPQRHHEK